RLLNAFAVAARDDDARPLCHEQPRSLEPDPSGRAGDEANAVAKAQVHGTASLVRLVTKLLLVRHGETDWNRDCRSQGHSDTHLNDVGREQAARLAAELDGIDVVYSSDLARARQTADILAARPQLNVLIHPLPR